MDTTKFPITGLTDSEVYLAREKYGRNELTGKKENSILFSVKNILSDPMFMLLLTAAAIYFINEKYSDGFFMISAIILVSAISVYQENKSRNALEALKSLTKIAAKVIRNGTVTEINTEDTVVGDHMIVEEGGSVPADGIIVQSNDFSLNESILTGESLSVRKSETTENDRVYQGTVVVGGLAICKVEAIGNNTRLGKIGKSLETIREEDSLLQKQIRHFVKLMVYIGCAFFLVVWTVNFIHSKSILDSLLRALTLAMSIIPEEIPVTFTTFMALGAWRLMKMGVIVKQIKTVEALGSASVICTDKTGTITENKMALAKLFVLETGKTSTPPDQFGEQEKELITLAMWSSEPIPFDPMEIVLHEIYGNLDANDERKNYSMIHEYPLDGRPPMMTHIFENGSGHRIIAAKGAPEALLGISGLNEEERLKISRAADTLSAEGYRVLGVGLADFTDNNFPEKQQQFRFRFKGLVAFYDPPKKNIPDVLEAFYKAGIAVKIITGDNATTTATIAKKVGFQEPDKTLNGEELMGMCEPELEEKVMVTNIFTRMFPEAKLRIINALKAKGQIVAMTGDGVNDGPALKAAHIGIAMGKKGSELAKQASSLILIDDDLAKMVNAIAMGRKIYSNLKKAIQYVISIHIPIVLTVFLPLILGWIYPNIFSPVHIIFLELIMGPTCSIIYENEPMEKNAMLQPPRPVATTFFKGRELMTSIIQGLLITAGTLSIYQYAVIQGCNENITRTMVFTTLITSNIFLTLVNRSFFYSFITTLGYRNKLVMPMIGATFLITAMLLFIAPLTKFFLFERPSGVELAVSAATGFLSVIWYEAVKLWKRKK